MKKLLIIFLFIMFSLPTFAEYQSIPKNITEQYQEEMYLFLDKLLFVRNSFNGMTYSMVIKKLYKNSKEAYKRLLIDKNNFSEEQKIKNAYSTISTFPEDICSGFSEILNKYKIEYYDDYISSNMDCRLYYGQKFLLPYKIKNTKKYLKFIKEMDFYQQKIYEMQVELKLF